MYNIYVYMYIYTHIYIHTYIHTHTHIHTHIHTYPHAHSCRHTYQPLHVFNNRRVFRGLHHRDLVLKGRHVRVLAQRKFLNRHNLSSLFVFSCMYVCKDVCAIHGRVYQVVVTTARIWAVFLLFLACMCIYVYVC